MHPQYVKLAPDSAPEQPEHHQVDDHTVEYVFPTSGATLGQRVAVTGHNGAIHLGMVIGANTDGTLTLIIYAHQQFDGQPNEALMAQHFRNNVKPEDVVFIS